MFQAHLLKGGVMFESTLLWINENLFYSIVFGIVVFSLIFQFFYKRHLRKIYAEQGIEGILKQTYPNIVPSNSPNVTKDGYRKDHMILVDGKFVCFSTREFDGSTEYDRN